MSIYCGNVNDMEPSADDTYYDFPQVVEYANEQRKYHIFIYGIQAFTPNRPFSRCLLEEVRDADERSKKKKLFKRRKFSSKLSPNRSCDNVFYLSFHFRQPFIRYTQCSSVGYISVRQTLQFITLHIRCFDVIVVRCSHLLDSILSLHSIAA